MSFSIVGIGEVLWDLLPGGPQLGGAPANFAYHAHSLGAKASVVTRVGDDELGRRVAERFKIMNLSLRTLQVDPLAPTGTANVTLDSAGVPRFHFKENVAWDNLEATPEVIQAIGAAHAICFGTLAQRCAVSRAAIQSLLAAAPTQALRIFDVNLRGAFYSRQLIESSLGLANVLKLNSDELIVLAKLFGIEGPARIQIQWLAEMFRLRLIALTCGEKGSLIYAQGAWSEQIPRPMPVADTVGAGDSFTAALVVGLLAGMTLDDTHAFANDVAGFVCSQSGATPALPKAFQNKCLAHSAPVPHAPSGYLSPEII